MAASVSAEMIAIVTVGVALAGLILTQPGSAGIAVEWEDQGNRVPYRRTAPAHGKPGGAAGRVAGSHHQAGGRLNETSAASGRPGVAYMASDDRFRRLTQLPVSLGLSTAKHVTPQVANAFSLSVLALDPRPQSRAEAGGENLCKSLREICGRTGGKSVDKKEVVGLGGFEPPTSRLSGVRSNQAEL